MGRQNQWKCRFDASLTQKKRSDVLYVFLSVSKFKELETTLCGPISMNFFLLGSNVR